MYNVCCVYFIGMLNTDGHENNLEIAQKSVGDWNTRDAHENGIQFNLLPYSSSKAKNNLAQYGKD